MAAYRTRVLASAVAGALTTAVAVVAAPAAHAASQVSYCFTWAQYTVDENGYSYEGISYPRTARHRAGKAYAFKSVWLIQVVDGHKTRLRSTRTNAEGCGTFSNTPTDGRLYVRAATEFISNCGHAEPTWSGRTRSTNPGDHVADLGTGIVKPRGFICSGVSRDRDA